MAYRIDIHQGATWELTVSETDSAGAAVDMTNVTALWMQIRRTVESTSLLAELRLTNGKITWVDQAGGVFKLALPASETSGLSGSGVYDLLQTWADGTVVVLLEGAVVVDPVVTR